MAARSGKSEARGSRVPVRGMVDPPVTLREIKESGEFPDWSLVRQSRLSTMPHLIALSSGFEKRDPKLNSKYSIFLDLAMHLFHKWNLHALAI